MIIALPYKRGKDEGRCLRYTLRGIAQFVKDPTVIILGDAEPWCRNLICDNTVKDLPTRDSLSNVIAKLHHFAHDWMGQETFLLFHDDIILLEPWTGQVNHVLPTNTPKPGLHQKLFDDTIARLAKSGRPPWECQDYESHSPMWMRAQDVCEAIQRWGVNPYEYRTLIGNWANPTPFPVHTAHDVKSYNGETMRIELRYFSVTDEAALSDAFSQLMAATFPLPCRFEAGIPWPTETPPASEHPAPPGPPPIPPPSASPSSEAPKPPAPKNP